MPGSRRLGAHFDDQTESSTFNIYSKNASRVDVYFYAGPVNEEEKLSRELEKEAGDNGDGIGASHQTGWTGLVANIIDELGRE
jgi:hypothetical protein